MKRQGHEKAGSDFQFSISRKARKAGSRKAGKGRVRLSIFNFPKKARKAGSRKAGSKEGRVRLSIFNFPEGRVRLSIFNFPAFR